MARGRPGPFQLASMAFDSARVKVVLFGGQHARRVVRLNMGSGGAGVDRRKDEGDLRQWHFGRKQWRQR
jgi:hypothetical protein